MTSKRGQITVFIIIGILILVILGALFFLREKGPEIRQNEAVTIDTTTLQSFISSCVKQTAQNAVVWAGLRGGVLEPDTYYINYGINVPYYFNQGDVSVPAEDDVKQAMQFYMDNYLKSCTDGFKVFKEQGYDVTEGDVASSLTITDNSIIFDIVYPVTIESRGRQDKRSNFNAEVNVNLRNILDAVNEYMPVQEQNYLTLPYGDLSRIATEKELSWEAVNKEEGSMILSFIDENILINGNPYVFTFAVRYKQTVEDPLESS